MTDSQHPEGIYAAVRPVGLNHESLSATDHVNLTASEETGRLQDGGSDEPAWGESGSQPGPDALLAPELVHSGAPLAALRLTPGTLNRLYRHGIHTVGDLARLSQEEFVAIWGMGRGRLLRVQRRLAWFQGQIEACLEGEPEVPPLADAPLSPSLVDEDVLLEALGLGRRASNALQRGAALHTIGQLARRSRDELLAIRNFGVGMAAEVERALAAWEQLCPSERAMRASGCDVTGSLVHRALDVSNLGYSSSRSAGVLEPVPSRASRAPEPHKQVAAAVPDTLGALVDLWLQGLAVRERDIMCARLGLGCAAETLESIAQRLGLTRERVRQLHARSLRRMAIGGRREVLPRFVLGAERLIEQLGGLASSEDLQRELPLAIPLGNLDPVVAAQLVGAISEGLVWLRGERSLTLADCLGQLHFERDRASGTIRL